MPVNLSIKNAPDHVVAALRERTPLGLDVLLARARERGPRSPTESGAMIREDRDSR